MSEKMKLVVMRCPSCGDKLKYTTAGETVVCMSCGNTILVEKNEPSYSHKFEINRINEKVEEIRVSSTALAFIDQFIDSYDWIKFALEDKFEIPELETIVTNLKTTAADDYKTWIAVFICLVEPFYKKIEYRKVILSKIIEEYKNNNLDAYGMYDAYKKVSLIILKKYDEIKVQVDKILRLALKYGASEKEVDFLYNKFNSIKIEEIKNTLFDKLTDVKEIVISLEEKNKNIANDLLNLGINAENVYNLSIEYYEKKNYIEAINGFVSIKDYKDSMLYVEKIAQHLSFSDVLFIKEKSYYLKKEKEELFSFIPIKKGKLDTPLMENIVKIVAVYVTKIYCFVKRSSGYKLIVYDTRYGKLKDFGGRFNTQTTYFNVANQTIYLFKYRKRDEIQQEFDLIKLNIVNDTMTTCLEGIVSVLNFYKESFLCFRYVKKTLKSNKLLTAVYSTIDNSRYDITDTTISVCGYTKDYIIYTKKAPDDYNKNLYAKQLKNDSEEILLERNITSSCQIINDKIFYYILDNQGYKYLISINADGTNRKELTKHIKEVVLVSGDWIYFIKEHKYNTALWKTSTIGQESVRVAGQIDEFVKIDSGYLYYIDDDRDLHQVRMDGTRNQVLCRDVEKVLFVNSKKVIYLSSDRLVKNDIIEKNGQMTKVKKYNKSIYAIDFDNQGKRKAVYDVIDAVCYYEKVYYKAKKKSEKKDTSQTVETINILDINNYNCEEIIELRQSEGCYVATCVYGSYDCPQVWTLRRYRDNVLGTTWYGRAFIRIYYTISPTLVKWFGHTKWFKKMWKGKLDKMVKNLQEKGVENTPYCDKIW